ncbi:unnamed protein product, partial [Didymodactylos carnosus]
MEIFTNLPLVKTDKDFDLKRISLSSTVTILFTQSKIIRNSNENSTSETITTTSKSNEKIENPNSGKPLIIILAITLPTLAIIVLLLLLFVCYRRRHSSIWLKKIDNDSPLKSIVVNTSLQP